MLKRIIFDIDGTLITGVHFKKYVANTFERYGINDPGKVSEFLTNIPEYEKNYQSYNKNDYLNFFSSRLGIKLDEEFLRIFFSELKYAVPKDSSSIKEMLEELRDYELVLLSNYFEESQRNRLSTMQINDFFTEYYGEKNIKPVPKAYFDAAGKRSIEECIIVGDDKVLDIEVPKKLGFKTIYVNSEKGDIKRVEDLPYVLKKTRF